MSSRTDYWNSRYQRGRIWGDDPCPSALLANDYFKRYHVRNVLVPGCGYGRNSFYFALQGFDVTAFDISDMAINQAVEYANSQSVKNIHYEVGDIFDQRFFQEKKFDGIYLSNVIHLFLKTERQNLMDRISSLLKPKGVFTFSCISIYDSNNYGIGNEIEPNTFIKHEGKPLHFFDEQEIKTLLQPHYQILDQHLHVQTESDPNGDSEDLQLWFVAAEKLW